MRWSQRKCVTRLVIEPYTKTFSRKNLSPILVLFFSKSETQSRAAFDMFLLL